MELRLTLFGRLTRLYYASMMDSALSYILEYSGMSDIVLGNIRHVIANVTRNRVNDRK